MNRLRRIFLRLYLLFANSKAEEELEREIAAWERRRNLSGARIKWLFTTERAREKMGRSYPNPQPAVVAAA